MDGSGLDGKAAGGYVCWYSRLDRERIPRHQSDPPCMTDSESWRGHFSSPRLRVKILEKTLAPSS